MADVLLYKASGPTDAYLLRQWLTERGIPCALGGESLIGLAGGIPVQDAWPTVWVRAEDAAAAKEALAAWSGPSLVHPAWHCATCGEENPATFDLCWRCERRR